MGIDDGFQITKIRHTIEEMIRDGASAKSVARVLFADSLPVPTESDQWDYKREFPGDRAGIGKLVVSIVALHNTFGGYLVFGVEEMSKDQDFRLCGIDLETVDVAMLRDRVRHYTGKAVEITSSSSVIAGTTIVVLHIPKRPTHEKPAEFCRDGPGDDKNRPLFRSETVYMRRLDECVQATTTDEFSFLMGPREIIDIRSGRGLTGSTSPIDNTLPSQGEIYQEFVGRADALTELWRWLAQDFKYAKVLAGEGGIGKTSIAYRFASEVARRRAAGFEKIIWLSAKAKQFVPLENDYREKHLVDFSDHESAIKAIARNMGMPDDEILDISANELTRRLKDYLVSIPVLIILDDLDSLEPEEQKRIMASAQVLGSTSSRFLLTTRRNYAFPQDDTVEIAGFSRSEFREYVETLTNRFGISVDSKYVAALRTTSGGSPLLAESILRLVRLGVSPQQAIQEWKGSEGEIARDAVLWREIDQLSEESKRSLLCTAHLGECSFTELLQVSGYSGEQLRKCITELENFYLLDAPKITQEERRFSISTTARLLVLQSAERLANNFRSIEEKSRQIRTGLSKSGGRGALQPIGAVVNQTMAHLRAGELENARSTIDAAAKNRKLNTNRDFQLLSGRVALAEKNFGEAKRCLQRAYRDGCRRPEYFELLWEAERESSNGPGIVDVAELALSNGREPKSEWLYRLAYGHIVVGMTRLGSSDHYDAVRAFDTASIRISDALGCGDRTDAWELIGAQQQIHDQIINIMRAHLSHDDDLLFRIAREMLQRKDKRREIVAAMLYSTEVLSQASPINQESLRRRVADLNQIFEENEKFRRNGGLSQRLSYLEDVLASQAAYQT